ncbi:Disease resistance protein RPS4B, partial [Linum perenne]
PSGIHNLRCVQVIHFSATSIASLPSSIHLLDKLVWLDLSYCVSLEFIPDNIHELAKLEILTLLGCTMIKSLPQLLPPELKYLHLGGCSSLQTLPSNMWNLNLWILNFENCPQLDYKLADQIVADFHSIPTTMCPESEGELFYSGSELPEWCSSMNCEMELPPPSANNGLAKGIAFGVVFSSNGTEVGQEMKCDVLVERTTVSTFSKAFRIHGGVSGSWSDYVLLIKDFTNVVFHEVLS